MFDSDSVKTESGECFYPDRDIICICAFTILVFNLRITRYMFERTLGEKSLEKQNDG